MSGTGKSTTTRLLHQDLGYEIVYFGGVVVGEVQRLGMPPGQESEKELREKMRRENGMAAIAIHCYPQIKLLLEQGKKVAIDGLYSGAEYDFLMEKLGNQLVTIAVHSDKELRYQRLAVRPVRPLTAEGVDSRDRNEVGHLDKAMPIVIATHHVVNNGTIEELDAKIIQIISKIETE